VMPKAWEPAFPQLGIYEDHSPRTPYRGKLARYNCWAFAAGEDHRRWDPDPGGQYYWPPGTARAYTIPAFVAAYGTRGYKLCGHGKLRSTQEKIVIYATPNGIVQHAARQLQDGRWISKMGDEEDIIHRDPMSLIGTYYGKPVLFLQRRRRGATRLRRLLDDLLDAIFRV
jgi:hypothetical protein